MHGQPLNRGRRVPPPRTVRATAFFLAALAVGAIASALGRPAERLQADDPDNTVVNVAELVPIYQDSREITWAQVDELRSAGKASVVYFFADDDGNYALVYDTPSEFVRLACKPSQPKKALCDEARQLAARTTQT